MWRILKNINASYVCRSQTIIIDESVKIGQHQAQQFTVCLNVRPDFHLHAFYKFHAKSQVKLITEL